MEQSRLERVDVEPVIEAVEQATGLSWFAIGQPMGNGVRYINEQRRLTYDDRTGGALSAAAYLCGVAAAWELDAGVVDPHVRNAVAEAEHAHGHGKAMTQPEWKALEQLAQQVREARANGHSDGQAVRSEPETCEWFARCDRDAVKRVAHVAFPDGVPTCEKHLDFAEGRSGKEQIEITLPRALVPIVDDTDALDEVEVSPGRAGSLRLRGSAEAIEDVHSRLWVAGQEGATSADRAAYWRWRQALSKHGIRT